MLSNALDFKFMNFVAFDSNMMLIEPVDSLICSKNDQKYQQYMY